MAIEIYAWAPLNGQTVLAGLLQWEPESSIGVFEYEPGWEFSPDAYELDPFNLRFGIGPITITAATNKGVPGVFSDAGPDTWGRYVIEKLGDRTPRNEAEWVLHPAAVGTGALQFTSTPVAPPPRRPGHQCSLEQLHEAAALIAEGGEPPPPMAQLMGLLAPSGGHRPKAILPLPDGTEVIAKFSRVNDSFDVPRVEAACLKAAAAAGVHTVSANVEILPRGKASLLVKRFDRDALGRPIHYASARTLLNLWRLEVGAQTTPPDGQVTYRALADLARRLGVDGSAEIVLRLMVFNYLIGNTDDHFQNVGFLREDGQWRFAPAFDLLPHSGDFHTPGIGPKGRARTLENFEKGIQMFGLDDQRVTDIVAEVATVVTDLPSFLREEGVAQQDVALVMARVSQLAHDPPPAELDMMRP